MKANSISITMMLVLVYGLQASWSATIQGVVTDTLTQAKVESVLVQVKGTAVKTYTNAQGAFSLNAATGIGIPAPNGFRAGAVNPTATVFGPNGAVLADGRLADAPGMLAQLPDGVYLVATRHDGRTYLGKTIKLNGLYRPGDCIETSGKAAAAVTLVYTHTYYTAKEAAATEGDTNVVTKLAMWWPNASNTGVPAGKTLVNCNTNLSTAGATYDGCLFNGGITVNASNITIKNSKINGVVSGNYVNRNLTMIDVEIDGQNSSLDATHGLSGYTCVRCKVHNTAKGFTGNHWTAEDCYVYDIYGEGDSHNEPVLGSTGNIVVRHCNLVANYNSSSHLNGGGMSAVIALYTHGDFWPDMDDVLVEKNRLEMRAGAVYSVYGGNSVDDDPSNIRFIGNVWVLSGCNNPITAWLRDPTNIWQNNAYDNGRTMIPEPATSQ